MDPYACAFIGTLHLTLGLDASILCTWPHGAARDTRGFKVKCACTTCRIGRILARAIMILGSLGASATAATVGVKLAPDGGVAQYLCSVATWAGLVAACYFTNRLSAAIMNGGR